MDRITGDLYAMKANSMTLISQRAAIMPQVSTLTGVSCQYLFQVFNPLSVADNSITLLAAKSTHVHQADRVVIAMKKEVPLEVPM